MEFLIGFLGALLAVLLFVLGGVCGWKAKHWDVERAQTVKAKELTAQEREKLVAEQQAFHALQNYNAETAYGMSRGQDHFGGDSD